MFSAGVSSSAGIADAASRTMQGIGAVSASRFCVTSNDSA